VKRLIALLVALSVLLPAGAARAADTYTLILRADAGTTVTVHVGDAVHLRLFSTVYNPNLMPSTDMEKTTELWRNFTDSNTAVLAPQGNLLYWEIATDISYKFTYFSRTLYTATAPGTVTLGAESAERCVCGYAINCPFYSKLIVYSVTVQVLP